MGDVSVSEDTPLLVSLPEAYDGRNPARDLEANKHSSRKWRYIWVMAVGLVLLSLLVGLNLLLMIPKAEEFANEAVIFDLQDIKLMGVSPNGVEVAIKGMSTIDYSRISNAYYRHVLGMGGSLLHKLEISIAEMEILVLNTETLEEATLGSVSFAPFNVETSGNRESEIAVLASLKPDTPLVLRTLKGLVLHPSQLYELVGGSSVGLYALGGRLGLGRFRFYLAETIPSMKYGAENVSIEQFQVIENPESQSFQVNIGASVDNPIDRPFPEFSLPHTAWDVYINDCDNSPTISLVNVLTQKVKLSFGEKVAVNVTASVEDLPPALNEACTDDTSLTPLNKFLSNVIKHKQINLLLRADKSNVFGDLDIPISYAFPEDGILRNLTSSLLHNVTMENIEFNFDNGFDKPLISGKVKAFVALPGNINVSSVSVSSIRGIANLFYHGTLFGRVPLQEWQTSRSEWASEDEKWFLVVETDIDDALLEIVNGLLFGSLASDIFTNGKAKVDIDAVVDVIVKTMLGSLEIHGIEGSGDTIITRGFFRG
ncbi:hypothetical protein BABINDRAFT_167937 [Babjeviella inositovora NRRL Y-12698]|uniref:Uncharacterized protein n=1 Tax=Babjeviella inositovora NRRL Y-12698 TaxID=984486 RepID=A0A1E3QM21_9ASCO|nr:uncharacterized protein BABINDRAFT_167937 [Babjeviella inositovora NRRL Y-12698]ODQ78746.1 hypothetical protein BABINDRAFT_167937 [Babjeviella inositovora NRRL Y-12698]